MKMTWEELKQKALEIGYVEQEDSITMDAIGKDGLVFYKGGWITVYAGHYTNDIGSGRSYDQMWQIMEALR